MTTARLRPSFALAVAVLLALPLARVAADTDTVPDGKTETPPPVEETTEVKGDIPDGLVGRWLFVGKIQPSAPVPLTRLLEISRGPEHLEVKLNTGQLPPAIMEKVEGVGAGNTWVPTADELSEIARRWDELVPPSQPREAKIEHQLLQPDAYPKEFEATFSGTDYAIVTREKFAGGRLQSTFTVYGVREQMPDGLAGNFASVSVASAPFPIPIAVQGDFKAYRITQAPRGFLAWLADLFRGCGRGR
jgi:hypothetical protein